MGVAKQGVIGRSQTESKTDNKSDVDNQIQNTLISEDSSINNIHAQIKGIIIKFLNPFVEIGGVNFVTSRDYSKQLQMNLNSLCDSLRRKLIEQMPANFNEDLFTVSICLKKYEKGTVGYAAPFAFVPLKTDFLPRPPSLFIEMSDPKKDAVKTNYNLSFSQRIIDNTDLLDTSRIISCNDTYYYSTGRDNIFQLFNSGYDNSKDKKRSKNMDSRSQIVIYPIYFHETKIGYIQLTSYRDNNMFVNTPSALLVNLIGLYSKEIELAVAAEVLNHMKFESNKNKLKIIRTTKDENLEITLEFSTEH